MSTMLLLSIVCRLLLQMDKVDKLDDLTSRNTISYLKSEFARHGIPDELISDNGPQLASSEFSQFVMGFYMLHQARAIHKRMEKWKEQDRW